MTTTLIDGIGLLYTGDPEREELPEAALVIEDGLVAWTGPAAEAPDADERVDSRRARRHPRFRGQPRAPRLRR